MLAFNVGGLMLSDLVFLTTAHFREKLPGTYAWFAIGPIVEGLVGGVPIVFIRSGAFLLTRPS